MIAFFDDLADGELPIINSSVSVQAQSVVGKTPYLVMKVNDTNLTDVTGLPAVSKYLATYVARKEDGILTFEEIASSAEGQPLLGFLKADVDQMGELFVFGLKRKQVSLDTMSRLATMSRLFDLFFSGYIESLLSSEFRDCYTVFSGGDDLFLVGPWDKIIKLAERIYKDFSSFAGNQDVHISAGISITHHDYPIARAADLVDKALEKSKDAGRDRITIHGKTLKWAEWASIKEEWLRLLSMDVADKNKVPSAFLYSLLQFGDMWQRYRDGDVLGLRYHPLLSNSIRRNLDTRKSPELGEWVQKLLKWPPSAETQMLLDNLGLLATLCLYSRRGGA